ncbi:MAG TPA: hypothetical protein VIM62_01755, partial [Acidobacteriaceae bacterium]
LGQAKPGTGVKTEATALPDSPLFSWESLANRLQPQPETATPAHDDAGAQGDHVACSAALPANDAFTLAVQSDHELKPEERESLLDARKKTQSGCVADAASAIASAEKATKTAAARAYALYLEGAAEFWRSEYEKAAATYFALTNARPAWVRETATYMVGRSLINQAQSGAFDEYGSFSKNWHADAKIIAASEAALDKYLQQYPKGTYALSARGLKRRGYWLAQDTAKLEDEYGALLLLSPEERNISDVELIQEIDNKITTPPDTFGSAAQNTAESEALDATQNPLMLAMLDLQAMRTSEATSAQSDSGAHSGSPLSLSRLQQQKPYFATQMPLYEFLLAAHAFYVENRPSDVLQMIPDAARQSSFSYVQFSRQVLRGMALEAMKDHHALGFWMQMLPGAKASYERAALELAIAYHEERAGEIRNVFAPGSPVHYPYLREVLLANVADADLLRTQAKNNGAPQQERNIALFTLLYKEVTRGDAADFLKDLALVAPNAPTDGYFTLDNYAGDSSIPDQYQPPAIPLGIFLHDKTDANFGCPGLRASEELLTRDADNPTALLCVADFVRLNESVTYLVSPSTSPDELGGTAPLFPGGNFVRMNTYKAVLANAKSSRNDKAYALFRSVNCYAPSGNNDCGGEDVPKAQRKAWFTTLKHDYAGTRWANALQYYW